MAQTPINVQTSSNVKTTVPIKHTFVSIPPASTLQELRDGVNSTLERYASSVNRQLANISTTLVGLPTIQTIGQQIQSALQTSQGTGTSVTIGSATTIINSNTTTIISSGGTGVGTGTMVSVTGVEFGPRYSDAQFSEHTTIELNPVFSFSTSTFPTDATFWVNFADGRGDTWIGPATFTNTGIGLTFDYFVPVDTAQTTWTVKGIGGDFWEHDVVPPGAVSGTFTVAAVGTCPPTDCTGIHFVPDPQTLVIPRYAPNGNSWNWNFYQLVFSQPSHAQDPAYFASRVTVQKGWAQSGGSGVVTGTATLTGTGFVSGQVGYDLHIGGVLTTIQTYVSPTVVTFKPTVGISNGSGLTWEVWNPAPDYEGNDDAFMGVFYKGRSIQMFQSISSLYGDNAGTVATLNGTPVPNWTYPAVLNSDGSSNLYRNPGSRVDEF